MEDLLGNIVRDFRRKELLLSQREFAEKVGISKPTLVSVEKGHRIPSLETYKKLSKVMGIPVNELMELKTKEGL